MKPPKDALAEVRDALKCAIDEVQYNFEFSHENEEKLKQALQILDAIEVVGDKELREIIAQKSWNAIEAIKDAGFLVLRGEKA